MPTVTPAQDGQAVWTQKIYPVQTALPSMSSIWQISTYNTAILYTAATKAILLLKTQSIHPKKRFSIYWFDCWKFLRPSHFRSLKLGPITGCKTNQELHWHWVKLMALGQRNKKQYTFEIRKAGIRMKSDPLSHFFFCLFLKYLASVKHLSQSRKKT